MTQGRLTSLPSATVTFGIGSANIGGSESAATHDKRYRGETANPNATSALVSPAATYVSTRPPYQSDCASGTPTSRTTREPIRIAQLTSADVYGSVLI